jgi:hypothetical protein
VWGKEGVVEVGREGGRLESRRRGVAHRHHRGEKATTIQAGDNQISCVKRKNPTLWLVVGDAEAGREKGPGRQRGRPDDRQPLRSAPASAARRRPIRSFLPYLRVFLERGLLDHNQKVLEPERRPPHVKGGGGRRRKGRHGDSATLGRSNSHFVA